jgi:hypothetical protein
VSTALLGQVVVVGTNEFAIENPKIDDAVLKLAPLFKGRSILP